MQPYHIFFFLAQGDSMQVLEAIIATGYYESHMDSLTPEYQLCFRYAQASLQTTEDGAPLAVNWDRQQVNEFIAKLGFIDSSRDAKCYIKHFYHVNEVGKHLWSFMHLACVY